MADKPTFVEPLTRGYYRRLPAVERQIAEALMLEPQALVTRAQQRDETASDFLSAEALVYFIRQAIRNDNVKTRDALFRELFERCMPYFRGKFRGFNPEDRKDLQGEVTTKVAEDLFATDDRGDFMQVRFWKYLDNKSIDADRKAIRYNDNTESLDTGYSGDGISEGWTRLEREVDRRLSPEQLAIIAEGLDKLPQHLRRVFLQRHYVGMNIGPDDPSAVAGNELTIAGQFGHSGRTIRNWLKEADGLLASFQEGHDGK